MTQSRKNSLIGSALLALAAIIWGSSFVAQTTGAEHVGPFTFIAMRSLLGSVALLPVIFSMDAIKKKTKPSEYKKMTKADYKYLLMGGGAGIWMALQNTDFSANHSTVEAEEETAGGAKAQAVSPEKISKELSAAKAQGIAADSMTVDFMSFSLRVQTPMTKPPSRAMAGNAAIAAASPTDVLQRKASRMRISFAKARW